MYNLGKILISLPDDYYIIHIGKGELKYFQTERRLNIEEIVVYEDSLFDYDLFEDEYPKRNKIIKDQNEVCFIGLLSDFSLIGNVRFDFDGYSFHQQDSNPKKIIYRKKNFHICDWEGTNRGEISEHSNLLLFLLYAENRYHLPTEEKMLLEYSKARAYVEGLNLEKIIRSVEVKVTHIEWTRRGSDNVMFCESYIRSSYEFYVDEYLEELFPKIDIHLSSSEDGEVEFINSDYPEKALWPQIAAEKQNELREKALHIHNTQYNKDAHIVRKIYSKFRYQMFDFKDDEEYIQQMKAKAKYIWEEPNLKYVTQNIINSYGTFRRTIEEHNPFTLL